MYYPITDSPHVSYQTETPASWPLSSRNSATSYPSNTMQVLHIDPKLMDNQNIPIRSLNNTHTSLRTSIRPTGALYCPLPSLPSMPGQTPPPRKPPSNSSWDTSHVHQTFRVTTSPPLNNQLALITQARKDTADALHKSQALELPSNFVPYCVGDCIWLEGKNLNTTHPSAKLVPRRYRPFLVTSVVSRTSFRLKLPPTWHIHNVFHRTLLTPYKETAINGNKYQEPAPDLVNGQPEWEVEQILGARKRCQQLQYLVRWKGFSEAHDSWEPLSNINTDQLIQEFYCKHPTAIRTMYKTLPFPLLSPSVLSPCLAHCRPSPHLLSSPRGREPSLPHQPPWAPYPSPAHRKNH
jgi:hypothetical protein